MGIEPTSLAWKAAALPLSYTRAEQPYTRLTTVIQGTVRVQHFCDGSVSDSSAPEDGLLDLAGLFSSVSDFGLFGAFGCMAFVGARRAWKACGQSLLAQLCDFGFGVWIAPASRALCCRRATGRAGGRSALYRQRGSLRNPRDKDNALTDLVSVAAYSKAESALCSSSNAASRTTVGPTPPNGGLVVLPHDQKPRDAPGSRTSKCSKRDCPPNLQVPPFSLQEISRRMPNENKLSLSTRR